MELHELHSIGSGCLSPEFLREVVQPRPSSWEERWLSGESDMRMGQDRDSIHYISSNLPRLLGESTGKLLS